MLWILLLLSAAPQVTLGVPDASGCAVPRLGAQRLRGGPTGLCVKQVLNLRLEGEPMVIALVEAPHRYDPRLRNRVFVYRLRGRVLEPRFLGSGFAELELDALVDLDGQLGLQGHDAAGPFLLRCGFRGFPLECSR